MPNSKVYEKNIFLPGGGSQTPFLKPQETTLTPPTMPAQINQTGSVPGSMTQPAAQLDPATVLGSSASKPPQNYFQGSGDTFQLTDYAKGTASNLQPPTPPTKPYTPSETDPTSSVYDYMLQPSAEEKKLAKDNESKKRLLLLGDALRHLGNLYFTTKGATPQQFNSPVMTQESLYQQKRAELQAQRAAALKNAMEQAKLQADQNYKNSMLGMKAAELERALANDQWNRQWTQFKWAGDQANKDREFDFKKTNADRTFAETVRSNKANENLRRQSNSIAAMNAQTSRDRLNFEKGKNGGLPKGYIPVPHYDNAKGGTTSWIVYEDKYKQYLPVIYKDLVDNHVINPIKDSDFNIWFNGSALKGINDESQTAELNYRKMDELVKSAYWSSGYTSWMQRLGAVRSDGKDFNVTTTKKLQQRKQAEANKPENKYKKYERNY